MNKQKIDQRLKEIEEEVMLLSGYLSESVENKLGVHLNNLKESFIQLQKGVVSISKGEAKVPDMKDDLKKLQSDLSSIITTIGSKDYKTKDDNLTRRIENTSNNIMKKVATLDANLQETAQKVIGKQDEIKKTLLENLDKLQSTVEAIQHLCIIDEDKQLGTEIALISDKVENFSEIIPEISKNIQKELLSLNTNLQENIQQTANQQIDIKDALLREIGNINESAEVIRRMCTTDEEKYIGSMTTTIYNKVLDLSDESYTFSENVKKWFLAIDKNIRIVNNQIVSKQEEVKKIILYDINKIADIAETLQNWCATEEDRPFGSEMITVSDKIEKMSEEIPDILERVTALLSHIEKTSSEVMRMRWFVIGAVAISIIVLIFSFFQ